MKRLAQTLTTLLAACALSAAAQNSVTVTVNGTTYTGPLTAQTPPTPVTTTPQLPKLMMTAAWPLNQPATNFPDETRSLGAGNPFVPTPITDLLKVFGPNHIRFDNSMRIDAVDTRQTPDIFAAVKMTTDYTTALFPATHVPIKGCKIEGGNAAPATTDRHCLRYDVATGILHEWFNVHLNADGSYDAAAYVPWDTTRPMVLPDGQTSADAAGLPVGVLTTRYVEIANNTIHHAMRFTVSMSRNNANNGAFVHPASHAAAANGTWGSPFYMGQRFRLDPKFSLPTGSPQIEVNMVNAMKTYGLVVADNGITGMVTLDDDSRWSTPANTAALLDLNARLTLANFIPVNSGPIIDSSGQPVQ